MGSVNQISPNDHNNSLEMEHIPQTPLVDKGKIRHSYCLTVRAWQVLHRSDSHPNTSSLSLSAVVSETACRKTMATLGQVENGTRTGALLKLSLSC